MLNEREKLVLNAVIDFYLTYGETIGSRTLVKKYNIELSSATIRNVMSDLEDEGYIAKTHSSSGRIPTDRGYKYYLDELLKIEKLSIEEKKRINNEYEQKIDVLDNILQETSNILSRLTSYASVVIEPDHSRENIKKIELVHIDDYLILAVIVTEDLSVTTKKIKLETPVSKDKLLKLVERVNENLKTQRVKKHEIVDLIKENFDIYGDIEKEIYKDIEGELYLSNSPGMFKDRNVNEVLDVLEMFNQQEEVKGLFGEIINSKEHIEGKVNVIFGDDLPIKGLEDFSLVYTVYKKGDSKGVIGVIGPKRMPYSKTMGLIDYISKEVEKNINK